MKEYKPLKVPAGMSEGLMLSLSSTRQLDVFGDRTGLKRRRFLFLKEPDFFYRIRLKNLAIMQKTKTEKLERSMKTDELK